jgi:hypothetical protein
MGTASGEVVLTFSSLLFPEHKDANCFSSAFLIPAIVGLIHLNSCVLCRRSDIL